MKIRNGPGFPCPEQVSGAAPWIETLLIAVVVVAVGYWLDPLDPFFFRTGFPWLILAPLFSALRYGFAHGLASALLLIIAATLSWMFHWFGITELPGQQMLGLLVVAMLAGEFSATWQRHFARMQVVGAFQRSRLGEFTRSYHLLKASHDRLEQRIVADAFNLRGALLQVRRMLIDGDSAQSPLRQISHSVLEIFSRFGWNQVAALHEVNESGVVYPALASLGESQPVDPSDHMVRAALSRKRTVSVKDYPDESGGRPNSPLAVVPIVDISEHVWGLIVIFEMPFTALQDENLRLLAVLGGHIGDLISSVPRTNEYRDVDEAVFFEDLRRAIYNRRAYSLSSILAGVVIAPSKKAAELADLFTLNVRGLDRVLVQPQPDGRYVILLLMPLTDAYDAEAYQARMERVLHERYGRSLSDLGFRLNFRELGDHDTVQQLMDDLCEGCGIDRQKVPDL